VAGFDHSRTAVRPEGFDPFALLCRHLLRLLDFNAGARSETWGGQLQEDTRGRLPSARNFEMGSGPS
jgi:hypothetical protein